MLLANSFVRGSLSVRQHCPRTLFAFGKQCTEIMSLQRTPCLALCLCSAPYQICFDLIFFAFSFGFVSSSSSSLSRFFAAAQLSRVSVLINVDSGFLFAVAAVAYTRVYLVGGIKGIKGTNQQPPPALPPLCHVIAGRVYWSRVASSRVCCVFAFIGNIIFDFVGNLISSSAAVQHSR